MRRSARLAEKEASVENESHREPKAKKKRSNNKILAIATLDNGTMVEALKYLNYCQLAKNSLVSKRFHDVIRTHRHKLALLYVDSIRMERSWDLFDVEPAVIKIFNKELSSEEYNEWVVRNNYLKQISLIHQGAVDPWNYELSAYGDYKGPSQERMFVFFARVKKLDHDTWPLFEHFICLLSDPFVSIRDVKLTPQTDTFNLLAATIDRCNRGRLQCEKLEFNYDDNARKFLNWIKDHMCCDKFRITVSDRNRNHNKQLFDFFASGSRCTSEIDLMHCHPTKDAFIDIVQKFLGHKNCDESQIVHSIRCGVKNSTADALKRSYAKYFLKEEIGQFGWPYAHVFEFVNADIGKKLHLAITHSSTTILKIINL